LNQRIKTILFPVTGLELEPKFVPELYLEGNVQRSINYIFGKTADGSVLIEGTEGGALKVASTGSGLEAYETQTGTAADAYAAGQTHEWAQARDQVDLKIDTTTIDISFQDSAGNWGDDIWIGAGMASISFVAWGIRFKNHSASDNTVYQVVSYY
jgi:hypothetical protein|tara:strand:+ start:2053 stop:2517 length:465 start_codon:yes stop_codon:yes gene_type:complete